MVRCAYELFEWSINMKNLTKVYLYQRFSSPKQELGSSLYRQGDEQRAWLERNKDWAVEAGLYEDKGLSGHTGAHLDKGSLGRLVNDIEIGRVRHGSIILVERFSRLSRMKVSETQELLRKIWKAGVTIVTAKDDARYGPEGEDDLGIQVKLLVEIHGAFSESQNRKERVLGSYNKRRDEARKGITPNIRKPFWLNSDGTVNDKHVVIKDMFELYLSGNGQRNILNQLKDKYPDLLEVQRMNPSTVIKWITSDVVLGYWRINEVERYKVYKAAVDESIYYKAQTVHEKRLHKNVNPNREWHLSGLVQCGHCGNGCSIQKSKHSWPVLRCSYKQRLARNACSSKGIFPYLLPLYFFRSNLEHFFLARLMELSQNEKANLTVSKLDIEIIKCNEKLQVLENKLLSSENEMINSLLKVMEKITAQLNELKGQREEAYSIATGNSILNWVDLKDITSDSKRLNLLFQRLDSKMVIKDDEVSFDHGDLRKTIKYLGYSRKDEAYRIEKNYADMGDLEDEHAVIFIDDQIVAYDELANMLEKMGEVTQLEANIKVLTNLHPKQVIID